MVTAVQNALGQPTATSSKEASACTQGARGKGGARGAHWPGGDAKFTRCALYKENMDS